MEYTLRHLNNYSTCWENIQWKSAKIANEVVGAKRLTRTYLCNLGLVETFPKTSVAVFYAFCVSKLFSFQVGILFPANAQRCVACRKTSATLIAHRA